MKHISTLFLVLVVLLSSTQVMMAQFEAPSKEEVRTVKVLNDCVQFTNESIHGMLIVHRLLENFNQKLNLYVDLEGQQLNFYSNADLPANIFEDPDAWFYDVSPLTWYNKALEGSNSLPTKYRDRINPRLAELKSIIKATNQLRFELEYALRKVESDKAALPSVYEKLEAGVKLYNQFFVVRNAMEEALQSIYDEMQVRLQTDGFYDSYTGLRSLHRNYLNGARHYRFKEKESIPPINVKLAANLKSMPQADQLRFLGTSAGRSGRPSDKIGLISAQVKEYMRINSEFLTDERTPDKYKQYGDYYYYHNIQVLSQFNRYGNGIVHEINELIRITQQPYLMMIEEPHIFKVIYPQKLEESEIKDIEVPLANVIPDLLEDREIVRRQEALKIDGDYVDIEIYDHQKLDRDIVSINFNGEWILEDFTITDKPKKMRLKLNHEGVNYLVLHAVNQGVIPPNTMALVYTINGKKNRIILNSDLEESELIELTR